MSSGRVHAAVTVSVGIPIASLVGYSITKDPYYMAVAALGGLSGLFVHPDLDQEAVTVSEHWILRYTMGFGAFFIGWWYPYAMIFPHRHFLTHFPIIGTAIRVVWLFACVMFTYLVLSKIVTGQAYFPEPTENDLKFWTVWACGLAVPDALHWLFDGCPIIVDFRARFSNPIRSMYDQN